MAAVPALTQARHLLTLAEYAALGETEHGYTELIEGRLLTSPNPSPDHNNAMLELFIQLRSAAPEHLRAIHAIDIDLELGPADEPGFSRRPDLIVVDQSAVERARADGGMLRASNVQLVIEIVSPGSRRTDHVDKRRDYADAGIPHYWIVDIDEPVSLVACYLTDEFGYRDHQVVSGTCTAETPFPVRIELDRLR
jgi:Uma2 family endonuclease